MTRIFVGAFGDPGHAFPAIALGTALAARGNDVTLQTWTRWAEHVERAGMRFAAAPEYPVFPTLGRALKPYEAVVRATADTLPQVRDAAPDVVVADILTLAPALAGETLGLPVATLIPHVDPRTAPGFPPYSIGARLPRTALGARAWSLLDRLVQRGLVLGRTELNDTRARLGLPPLDRFHGGISEQLALVATFPQLEYPRPPLPATHVVGPLVWEQPFADVELPPGDAPLVLVAPSTVQDPAHRLLRAAVTGLAGEPVRVLATTNRRPLETPLARAPNARVVDWLSYSQTMAAADVVVCHGGHGTVARALAAGCVPVVVPAGGDMNENAARVDWAGAGVRLPRRWAEPEPVRLAVARALRDPRLRARARELQAWAAANDGAERAAVLVERLAAG